MTREQMTIEVDDLIVGPAMIRAWRAEIAQLKAELEKWIKLCGEQCTALEKEREKSVKLGEALKTIEKGPTLPLSPKLVSAKAQAIYVAQWSQEVARKTLLGDSGNGG